MTARNSTPSRKRSAAAAGHTPQAVPEPDARPASGVAGDLPSREAIAARAYALFLARGGAHGDDWADWLQAEAELRREAAVDEPGEC
jgi:hypothetical protein